MNDVNDYLNSLGEHSADIWQSRCVSAEKEVEELTAQLSALTADYSTLQDEYNSEVETVTALGVYLDQAHEDVERLNTDIYAINNSLREQTELTGKYIEQNLKLKQALSRFSKIDITEPIRNEIAWDILNARAVLGGCEK